MLNAQNIMSVKKTTAKGFAGDVACTLFTGFTKTKTTTTTKA